MSVARMEPTGPARSGRPDDKLRAIRGRQHSLKAAPGFRCAPSGLQQRGKRSAERRMSSQVRAKRGARRAPPFSLSRVRWRAGWGRCAAFRRSRLRHSPPAQTPMAQLQNRVSRGGGATGVLPASPDDAAVKHAPCGPVLLPVDRGPEAARERCAKPRAGTASRSAFRIASGMRPQMSGILCDVTERGTFVKWCHCGGDMGARALRGVRPRSVIADSRRFPLTGWLQIFVTLVAIEISLPSTARRHACEGAIRRRG
jgi:hypothetical protein